jgi:hypothetical protein
LANLWHARAALRCPNLARKRTVLVNHLEIDVPVLDRVADPGRHEIFRSIRLAQRLSRTALSCSPELDRFRNGHAKDGTGRAGVLRLPAQ